MSEAHDPVVLHVVFDRPCIPPNTGNAIRMCAGTGAHLHLAGPLGFNLEEKNLRRGPLLEVRVNPEDLGRVIGRSGRTARALRTVTGALSEGGVRVDIVDVDRR